MRRTDWRNRYGFFAELVMAVCLGGGVGMLLVVLVAWWQRL